MNSVFSFWNLKHTSFLILTHDQTTEKVILLESSVTGEVQETEKMVKNGFLRHNYAELRHKGIHVIKFAFSRKFMVFLEDLKENIKVGEITAIEVLQEIKCYFCILAHILSNIRSTQIK